MGGHSGEGWGAALDKSGGGGSGGVGMGRYSYKKTECAILRTLRKSGALLGWYGRSFLWSLGWNPHQNAVSHSLSVKKCVRVIVMLRAMNFSKYCSTSLQHIGSWEEHQIKCWNFCSQAWFCGVPSSQWGNGMAMGPDGAYK